MAIFKCKMCGGSLEVAEEMTVCECEYCGTMQTLPKTDNEQNLNMINRANHFRQQCEFDKAMEIYERILKNSEDAEIYWSIVLCRYGIEYVDDPLTKKKIPTCHRTQYKSILNDVDYLEALSHADIMQREVFESEAKYIDTVQKGILEISNKEEPFDVFICYKETDANGRRTQDSVLAQDLYYQLTREGFKVFFSRITLEDKLGTEYEPYIFAALNSSKVMVVVGTKPEYFDAVWVKNEWSRYLMMMQEDHSKTIIPAYRDMDPYDLPDALSMYQAQDMSKLGFMQDLIRGIGKIAKTEPEREVVHQQTIVQTATSGNIENLLKRGNLALEDGDWTAAGNFFEQVLNENVEEARAYLGLLMVDLKVPSEEVLVSTKTNFGGNANFIKAKRFGDSAFKEKMDNLLLEADYSYAVKRFNSAVNDTEIEGARKLLEKLGNYKDSAEKAKQCEEKKNEYFYQIALKSMDSARDDAEYTKSRELFEKLGDYKDSAANAELCAEKGKEYLYKTACSEMEHANAESGYKRAAELFSKMNGYKDSEAKARECLTKAEEARKQVVYEQALDKKKNNTIESQEDAIKIFESIEGFADSDKQIEECRQQIEKIKQKQAEAEKKAKAKKRKIRMIAIISAIVVVFGTSGTLVTTKVILPEMKYNSAVENFDNGNYANAILKFEELEGYKDSDVKLLESRYENGMKELGNGNYDTAVSEFKKLGYYKDSKDMIVECKYQNAVAEYDNGNYGNAIAKFKEVGNYKDSADYVKQVYDEFKPLFSISAGGYHTVGLKSDGTVVAMGYNEDGECDVERWTDIVAVSAGERHTVGLKSDGTVVAVGDNYCGQCDVERWTNIVAVSAGETYTVGLKSDGTVVAVGNNRVGRCDEADWTDIVAVTAGEYHTVGLKSDGTVVAVGYNTFEQCNVEDWTDIVAVSAGAKHTVGLKSNGTVVAVGYNYFDQCNVEDWTDIVAVSAGTYNTVGLKSDGTVVAVGDNGYNQCDVADWTDIVAVSSGYNYTIGLRSDGTVVAVGDNDDGKCNVSDWKDIKTTNK